jgi:hypothetical protein
MDVAPWVPDDFWRGGTAIEAASARLPDLVWSSRKYFWAIPFDSTMNFYFFCTVLDCG